MITPKRSARALSYEAPFFKVFHVEADFKAFTKHYDIVHFGPRAGVVAVRDNKILLVRQYRLLSNRLTYEIPGGTVGVCESAEAAVARECLEETGVACQNLVRLVEYYPGLDNVDNQTTVFYSEQVDDRGTFSPDPGEVVETAWVPLDECLKRIASGEIADALTVIGLLAYQGRVHLSRR